MLIFITHSFYAQEQLTIKDDYKQKKIEQVEKDIQTFTRQRIKNYQLSSKENIFSRIKREYNGNIPDDIKEKIIQKYKKWRLRKEFFERFPELREVYKNITLSSSDCNNSSLSNYSFYSQPFSEFIGCENDPDNPIPPPSSSNPNDMSASVSYVNQGWDPVLDSYEIQVPRTNNNGSNPTIRLNDTQNGGNDVTKMEKEIFSISTDEIIVEFSAVLDIPSGHDPKYQPYFQMELLNNNGITVDSKCIIAEADNNVFKKVPGEEFFGLVIQGGIESVKSKETGRSYFTARKTMVSSTFDETTCKGLIGTQMEGNIIRVKTEPYEYTIENTGEVITLSHTYAYVDEEQEIIEENIIGKEAVA